jgi:hypothetical protein
MTKVTLIVIMSVCENPFSCLPYVFKEGDEILMKSSNQRPGIKIYLGGEMYIVG